MTKLSPRFIRKGIHLLTGILILLLTYFVRKDILLWLILAGSIFPFITFRYKSFYLLHKTSDGSLGTLFYPLGILSSFLILYNLPIWYFQTPLMVLTLSDTVANFIGQIKIGNGIFRIGRDLKSFYGIIGYALSTLAIAYFFLPVSKTADFHYILLLLILSIGLELISWRGSDNLSIPLGLSLFFLLSEAGLLDHVFLTYTMIILSLGCFLLFRFHILTRYGSLAAWLLGTYFLAAGGLQWIIPVMLFFLSSVLLTKIHSAFRVKEKKETLGRNAWQVTANILWAVLSTGLFLVSGNEIFLHLFIAFLAAVTADTWASEAGPLFNKKSFSLADRRWHEAGITGGVSPAGTLASLVGAVVISAFSYYFLFGQWNFVLITVISVSAFLACFVDSLLGAFVEGRLLSLSWFSDDRPGEKITPNDLVNLAGSLSAGFFFYIFSMLI
jgi:uncharacterized protein (TIGR00297 family)